MNNFTYLIIVDGEISQVDTLEEVKNNIKQWIKYPQISESDIKIFKAFPINFSVDISLNINNDYNTLWIEDEYSRIRN